MLLNKCNLRKHNIRVSYPLLFTLLKFFYSHYRAKMTSSTQTIPEKFLDWCFKNTNIFESTEEDEDGNQINLIHFAAKEGYIQFVKKLVYSGIDVNLPAPTWTKMSPLHYASDL